jgi:hypothetical protein
MKMFLAAAIVGMIVVAILDYFKIRGRSSKVRLRPEPFLFSPHLLCRALVL